MNAMTTAATAAIAALPALILQRANPGLYDLFQNAPSDARNWVVDVGGENIVTTCDTCRKDSVPGT